MAAAHRTRRRTHFPRRRKQTACKKTVHRDLLPKRKKQNLKQGKQGRKVARKMGPKDSKQDRPQKQGMKRTSDEFVSKVLRQLHRDKIPISTKAKGKMITFIKRFYNNVSDQAKCSKRAKSSSTIGTKELQNALKRVMRKKQAMEMVQTIRKVSRRR